MINTRPPLSFGLAAGLFSFVQYNVATIDLVLRLITEKVSHRDIEKRTGISKNTIGKWAAGLLPSYYTRRRPGVRGGDGEKIYATSTKLCKKHHCKLPCVACDAWRYRRNHPELFDANADPPPSLYDERHERLLNAHRRQIEEAEERIFGDYRCSDIGISSGGYFD